MRKLWKFMSVALCGAMLLTGCGNSGSEKDSGGFGKNKITEQSLSSAFSTDNDTIWYFIDTSESHKALGKDSYPSKYFISNNGEFTYYSFANEKVPYSLGELSQMTDDEIIEALESTKSSDSSDTETKIALCNQAIDTVDQVASEYSDIDDRLSDYGESYTISEIREGLEKYKNYLETTGENDTINEYGLESYALYTDSTGNNVMTEGIAYSNTYTVQVVSDADSDLEYIRDVIDNVESYINEEIKVKCAEDILNDVFSSYPEYADSFTLPDEIVDEMIEGNDDAYNAYMEDAADCAADWMLAEMIASGLASHAKQFMVDDFSPISNKKFSYVRDIQTGLQNAQVYDSWYGGYRCEDGYLVTRTDENVNFVLDSLDTPNAVIDPKSDNWGEEYYWGE